MQIQARNKFVFTAVNPVSQAHSSRKNKGSTKTQTVSNRTGFKQAQIPGWSAKVPHNPKGDGAGYEIKSVSNQSSKEGVFCDICNKSFSSKASRRRHSYIHENRRQFVCNLCGKGFNSVSSLIGHQQRHDGNRPYKCHFCERRFVESSNRTTHERTHTKEKPYTCNLCFRSFTVSSSLVRHKLIHKYKSPYYCSVCNKRYRRNCGLQKHMKQIHKILMTTESDDSSSASFSASASTSSSSVVISYTCALCNATFQENKKLRSHSCIQSEPTSKCTGGSGKKKATKGKKSKKKSRKGKLEVKYDLAVVPLSEEALKVNAEESNDGVAGKSDHPSTINSLHGNTVSSNDVTMPTDLDQYILLRTGKC